MFRISCVIGVIASTAAGYFFSNGTMNGPAAILFGAISGVLIVMAWVGN